MLVIAVVIEAAIVLRDYVVTNTSSEGKSPRPRRTAKEWLDFVPLIEAAERGRLLVHSGKGCWEQVDPDNPLSFGKPVHDYRVDHQSSDIKER